MDLSAKAGSALDEIHHSASRSGEHASAIESSMASQSASAQHLQHIVEAVADQSKAIESDVGAQRALQDKLVTMSGLVRSAVRAAERTTSEQAQSLTHLRDSVAGVEESAQSIRRALVQQSDECDSSVRLIQELADHAERNTLSARGLSSAIASLRGRSASLRGLVARFHTADGAGSGPPEVGPAPAPPPVQAPVHSDPEPAWERPSGVESLASRSTSPTHR